MRKALTGALITVFCAVPMLADFQYQQSTQITGGAMAGMMKMAGAFSKQAREPMVSQVYLKGNRMAHVNAHNAQVWDLDKETITHIDFDRKQYSVQTFAQMKQAIEEAMAKAKQDKAEGSEGADMTFKASVKDTGNTKQISNMMTRDYILTLVMEGTNRNTNEKGSFSLTNDIWMAPEIKGYQEVRDFNKRMAEKMGQVMGGSGFASSLMGGRADMSKAMQEAAKEMSKLKGIPVLTVSRMGSTPDNKPLPAASEAPEAAKSDAPDVNVKEAAGKSAASAALGRLGGLGGGLGGFGRKKKAAEEAPAAEEKPKEQAQARQAGPAILMETTTESSGFSSESIDASKFDVPAGFKQVEPDLGGRRRGR